MIISIALFLLMLPDLKTVPSVDLRKYSGVWYEIARLPNKFQKDCASDVTADYTLQQDGKIKVVNRCREDGKPKPKEAEGVARVAEEGKGSTRFWRYASPLQFFPSWTAYGATTASSRLMISIVTPWSVAMIASICGS